VVWFFTDRSVFRQGAKSEHARRALRAQELSRDDMRRFADGRRPGLLARLSGQGDELQRFISSPNIRISPHRIRGAPDVGVVQKLTAIKFLLQKGWNVRAGQITRDKAPKRARPKADKHSSGYDAARYHAYSGKGSNGAYTTGVVRWIFTTDSLPSYQRHVTPQGCRRVP
jgi:hypothetical protein